MKKMKTLLFSILCLSMVAGYCVPTFANEEELPVEQETVENTENTQEEITESEEEITESEEEIETEAPEVVEEEVPAEEENVVNRNSEEKSFTVMYVLHDESNVSMYDWENTKVVYKNFTSKDFPDYESNMEVTLEFNDFLFTNAPAGYKGFGCGAAGNFAERISSDLYRYDLLKSDVIGCRPADPSEVVQVKFVEKATNKEVAVTTTYVAVETEKLTASYFQSIPKGYEIVDGEYQIITDSGKKSVTVFVEKSNKEIQIKLNFFENQNGHFVKVGNTKVDVSKLNIIEENTWRAAFLIKSLEPYVTEGYRLYDGYDDTSKEYIFLGSGGFVPKEISISVIVQKADSDVNVEGPSIEDGDLLYPSVGITITPEIKAILESSCDEALKSKIEEALLAGKTISFKIDYTTKDINDSDRDSVSKFMQDKGYSLVQYFDLGISVMDSDGNELGKITETSQPLSFEFKVPDSLKKPGRKFNILRVHNGVVTELTVTEDYNYTFTSNQFSTYAIGYTDNQESGSGEDKPETTPEEKPETKPENKTEGKEDSVNTAIETSANGFITMMLLSLAVLLVLGFKKIESNR